MAMPAPSCSSSSSVRSGRKRWRPKSRMRWAAATTRPVPSRAGYQNGYRRGRLRTAEGPIEYGVPQVADRAEPFSSRIRAGLAGRTAELEQLAVEMYARGLSTRDIEAAFRDGSGASLLSRTAVSQVTERLWQEYEVFAGRDLSEFAVAYFFVDGVAERLHAGLPREAVLCAWGITEDGRKVLLHLAPGTKEDTASCTAFVEDLKRRGLADPLLAVTDGAPGLIRAVETCKNVVQLAVSSFVPGARCSR